MNGSSAAAAAAAAAAVLSGASIVGLPMDTTTSTAMSTLEAGTAAAVAAFQQSMLNGGIFDGSTGPSNDMKKIKVDHDHGVGVNPNGSPNGSSSSSSSGGKSRVIHIRNISQDTTINDLLMLASPFGAVTNHLLAKSKHQAFIEFQDPMSAVNMANYWVQTTVGGMPTAIQPTIR